MKLQNNLILFCGLAVQQLPTSKPTSLFRLKGRNVRWPRRAVGALQINHNRISIIILSPEADRLAERHRTVALRRPLQTSPTQ